MVFTQTQLPEKSFSLSLLTQAHRISKIGLRLVNFSGRSKFESHYSLNPIQYYVAQSICVSSLNWSFSCFLCHFCSTRVCSEYTFSFLLHHRYLFRDFQKVRGPATYKLRLAHYAEQVKPLTIYSSGTKTTKKAGK